MINNWYTHEGSSLTATEDVDGKSLTAHGQTNFENKDLDDHEKQDVTKGIKNDLAACTCTHRKRKREERSDGRTCKKNKVS